MGNALARSGNYQEAVDVYDKVLKQEPDNMDAKYNKELLEKELEKQQQYKQQQSGQNGKDKDKEQQKQQEQGQNNREQAGEHDADDADGLQRDRADFPGLVAVKLGDRVVAGAGPEQPQTGR